MKVTREQLREWAAEYPVPLASLVVAVIAGSLLWYESGDQEELVARRDELRLASDARAKNLIASRNLQQDVVRAKAARARIDERALDFSSTIASSAFLSRVGQGASVTIEGLPTQRGVPLANPVKPYAQTEYSVAARGDFPSLLAFIGELTEDRTRAIVVTRAQFIADDNTSKTGQVKADIGFRVWGVSGGHPASVAKAPPDKTVVPAATRLRNLAKVESLIDLARTDLAGAVNPFGESMSSTPVVETPGVAELDGALRKLLFTVGSINGNPVVKIDGVGSLPKRINNEFDVVAGGRTHRLRIIAIGDDSFTVITTAGKKITISPHP